MNLIKPYGSRLTYGIRVRNWDGRKVRIPGERDKEATVRLGQRIEMLIRAKQNGDPPPAELQKWIDNMPQSLAERLIELELITRHRIERGRDLAEQLDQFEKVIACRKTNSATHAKIQSNRVRRL